MKTQESKLNKAVAKFVEASEKFKEAEKAFDSEKSKFYGICDDVFAEGETVKRVESLDGGFSINRIQRVSISFDPDKLEKRVGKKVAEKCIRKSYVMNEAGAKKLFEYLKGLGADPSFVRSCLFVEKHVDEKQLEKLEEVGIVSIEELAGCYTTNKGAPYYKVSRCGNERGERK